MKLMRVIDDVIVEIVDAPDTVAELTEPAREAVTDPETGEEIEPARAAVYADRPALPDDFYHPGLGFVPAPAGVEAGMIRDGEGFVPPPPPPPFVPPPVDAVHVAWLSAALAEAGKLAAVETAVAKAGPVAAALWSRATTIRIDDADVKAIGKALKLDLQKLFDRADALRRERGV